MLTLWHVFFKLFLLLSLVKESIVLGVINKIILLKKSQKKKRKKNSLGINIQKQKSKNHPHNRWKVMLRKLIKFKSNEKTHKNGNMKKGIDRQINLP